MPGLSKSIARSPEWLAWLLVLAVTAQAAIPLQVHTVLAKDLSGQVVLLCTWEGPRLVALGESDDAPTDPVDRISPACLFSQLLAAASLAPTTVGPSPVFVASASLDIPTAQALSLPDDRIHAIRGPPDRFVTT
jgi:hypothetical protein